MRTAIDYLAVRNAMDLIDFQGAIMQNSTIAIGLVLLAFMGRGERQENVLNNTGTFDGHTQPVTGVTFSPDSKTMASASFDATIKLWDVVTGKLRTILNNYDPAGSVAFSPDGKLLASTSFESDLAIKVWDVNSGKETMAMNGHTNFVNCVTFARNSTLLASASWDKTIKLWDVTTEKEIATLRGHTKAVFAVAFSQDAQLLCSGSPDGKRVASGYWDGTVRLWDLKTGEEDAPFPVFHGGGGVCALNAFGHG